MLDSYRISNNFVAQHISEIAQTKLTFDSVKPELEEDVNTYTVSTHPCNCGFGMM